MESVSATQAKALPPAQSQAAWKRVCRAVVILAVAGLLGWGVPLLAKSYRSHGPAGFGRGILDGAMMPLSFPHLLLGKDVEIYAARNTGRTYKLGYTVGVNGCGAIFFGFFFWRVQRWRGRRNQGRAD